MFGMTWGGGVGQANAIMWNTNVLQLQDCGPPEKDYLQHLLQSNMSHILFEEAVLTATSLKRFKAARGRM